MWKDHRVILSIFCGRQDRTPILLTYLVKLHEAGHLDEVHLWDYCKSEKDREWLNSVASSHPTLFRIFAGVRRWHSYYEHYHKLFSSDDEKVILIKCDDDVVSIDVDHFTDFLDFRIDNPDYFLVFPNIVNNGVAAYHQQQNGVIPTDLMELELPLICGSLWESKKKCLDLHYLYLDDPSKFAYAGHVEVDPPHRVSINFFAVSNKHIRMGFGDERAGADDEHFLSVEFCIENNVKKAIFNGMHVSHLTFHRQDEQMTFGEMKDVIGRYAGKAGVDPASLPPPTVKEIPQLVQPRQHPYMSRLMFGCHRTK